MSDPAPSEAPQERRPSVLASLPHTRPQPTSKRRTSTGATGSTSSAARSKSTTDNSRAAGNAGSAKQPVARQRKQATRAQRSAKATQRKQTTQVSNASARKRPTKSPAAEPEQVPRQGYEIEGELRDRTPVMPPSTSELVGSLAELAGDLAQSGMSAGGKLLKSALSRFSGS